MDEDVEPSYHLYWHGSTIYIYKIL